MSWLRPRPSLTSSPSRPSRNSGAHARPIDAANDFDPKACYDSFCKHWQQAYDIMLKIEVIILIYLILIIKLRFIFKLILYI